jgi:hypothetical protein
VYGAPGFVRARTQRGVETPNDPVAPVHSAALVQGRPQEPLQPTHWITHCRPQSHVDAVVQLEPNVVHAAVPPPVPVPVLVVPPLPVVLVHVHPLVPTQATSVNAEHVPNCVPEQLPAQTHPVVALHPCAEDCAVQEVPTWVGVPPHVPRSTQPAAALQSAPVRAAHASGVPEHVPCELAATVLFPARCFAFSPGQSLHAPAASRRAPTASGKRVRSRGTPPLKRRRPRRASRKSAWVRFSVHRCVRSTDGELKRPHQEASSTRCCKRSNVLHLRIFDALAPAPLARHEERESALLKPEGANSMGPEVNT